MRIVYILPSLANTAPIRIAQRIADYCYDSGHDVEIAYFDDIVEITTKCKTRRIDIKKPIKFDDYDIIHSHMMRPDQYVASNKKNISRATTISTIHCDIYYDLFYSYGRVIAGIFSRKWINSLKKLDVTVQVTPFLMEKYSNSFKKNILISNGVEIIKKEPDKQIITVIDEYHKTGHKVILSYSNIVKRKGLKQVLDVLTLNSQLAYLCIGRGECKKELIEQCNKLGLNDRVYFVDFIDYPYNLIPYVDIVIIPSYSESFCLSLHEAGMMGASVVCSRISAFTDVFSEKEVSYFELDNKESLLSAVSEGIILKTEKGGNIQVLEKEKYTTDRMVKDYLDLYTNCRKERDEQK